MKRVPIQLGKINAILPLLGSHERIGKGIRRAIEDGDQQEVVARIIENAVIAEQLKEVFTNPKSDR